MAPTDSTPGKAPAFQFYPNDFLSDQNVICMSLQERGAYITLLCLCWQNPLPSDVSRIARLCGVPLSMMRKLWPALSVCFRAHPSDPDLLIHPRLERERQKQADYKRRQSDNGHKGGRPKKGLGFSGLSQTEPTDKPAPVISETQTEPTKSSSSSSSSLSSFSDFSQSATRSPRAVQSAGLMAGTLPRDHLNCHPPCIRVCVSEKQHAILRGRHGGDDAALDAFYAEVRDRLSPDVPIGDTPWKFWDAQFAAKFGTVASVNSRTAGNAAALARFVARGKS